ncbi:MAG: Jag N-terminal domain-containing protein, partial [Acidimicrobiales bacterium]
MEWVETTGRTLEEAKEAALDQLGVAGHDAEFETLAEARNGLFGRVRSEARVRARVKPTKPRAKEDRKTTRRRGATSKPSRESTSVDEQSSNGEGSLGPSQELVKSADRSDVSVKAKARKPGRPQDKANGDQQVDENVPITEQGEVGREFLTGLMTTFGYEAVVELTEIDEESIELSITGSDLGLLIGSKGATLSAIQDVTRTVVQRRTRARNGRIYIDVADYRKKRKAALGDFTRNLAREV